VAELIGRNPEVAVVDVDESAKDVDEKPVAAADLLRFDPSQQVLVSFRVVSSSS
jgi:hypothetical protein